MLNKKIRKTIYHSQRTPSERFTERCEFQFRNHFVYLSTFYIHTVCQFTFAFIDDQIMNNPTIARKFIFLGSAFNQLLHDDFSNIPITACRLAIVIQCDHCNIPNIFTTYFKMLGFTLFKVTAERQFTCLGSIFT